MKELNKEIEELKQSRVDLTREATENDAKISNNIEKLQKKQSNLYERFEEKVKSYFGVVDVKVIHNNQVCQITADHKEFFNYTPNFIKWQNITEETALEIKALYNELYGVPITINRFPTDDFLKKLER